MRKRQLTKKEKKLFSVLPEKDLVKCVEEAFSNLLHTRSGPYSINQMQIEKQNICGLFHSLIVTEIVNRLPGWKQGRQGLEPDIVHESGITLQVKTKSSPEGIAGNRYSSKNEYSDPSEYYLCVNFLPNDCICKIRAGWIESSWWKPQTGNGNASVLSREKLDSLPLLKGNYLKNLNLIAINGVGEKTLEQLHKQHIFILKDLLHDQKLQKAKKILSHESIEQVLDLLSFIKEVDDTKDKTSLFSDDLIENLTEVISRIQKENKDPFGFFRMLAQKEKDDFKDLLDKVMQ